jgi:hypothetical protein
MGPVQGLNFNGEQILSGMSGLNDAAHGDRRKMSAAKAAIQARTANRRLASVDFSVTTRLIYYGLFELACAASLSPARPHAACSSGKQDPHEVPHLSCACSGIQISTLAIQRR